MTSHLQNANALKDRQEQRQEDNSEVKSLYLVCSQEPKFDPWHLITLQTSLGVVLWGGLNGPQHP